MIVRIEWEDSRLQEGWVLVDQIDLSTCNVETVGYLVEENSSAYIVAANKGDNGNQYSGIISIPKRCVISFNEIKI